MEARYRIRRARREEAEALSALALRSKAVWGYSAEFLERCRPLLSVSGEYVDTHEVYVAEVEGRPGGFYSVVRKGEVARLDLLFVEPDRLGRGIGSVLLAHALDRARAIGTRELVVESDPGAEGFYLRAGGVRVGTVGSALEEGRRLPVLRFAL